MKKLIVVAALGLVAVGALAQGAFTFGNKNLIATPPIDARVFGPDGVTGLAGAAYWAQAYIKLPAQADTSYVPVGAAVNFRTGANAGYIAPVIVGTTYADQTDINVQMRAWDAAGGTSYEAALAAGKLVGSSAAITVKLTVTPATPADMSGIASFSLVPEPSTLALGVLGAAALLLRRRS
jgi:hypothetical protein